MDWPYLSRYQQENNSLPDREAGQKRIVFMGDSITEQWTPFFSAQFADYPLIGRGIGGQTTPQMLVRFTQDVLRLDATSVVILAGTNDIAGNTGPSSIKMILDNIRAMITLAKSQRLDVVLCSVLPASVYHWAPKIDPADSIVELNSALFSEARKQSIAFVDFYSAMVNDSGGLSKDLAEDGVHPTELGFRIMADCIRPTLETLL